MLRLKYGPREQSVMHAHPAGLGVHLTDAHARFTFPGGKTEELHVTAGEVRSYPAGDHLPETLSDQPFELVFIELKALPAAKKLAAGRVATKKRAVKKPARCR